MSTVDYDYFRGQLPGQVDVWKLSRSGNLDALKGIDKSSVYLHDIFSSCHDSLLDYMRSENVNGRPSVVSREDEDGNTALHCAAQFGQLNVIFTEYLIFQWTKLFSQHTQSLICSSV